MMMEDYDSSLNPPQPSPESDSNEEEVSEEHEQNKKGKRATNELKSSSGESLQDSAEMFDEKDEVPDDTTMLGIRPAKIPAKRQRSKTIQIKVL